jgi:acetylxylan esterase
MFFKSFCASSLFVATALGASLVQLTGFSPNPTNVGMYVYKPDNAAASPALIVAIHHCQGSASGYYGETQYAQYANTNGYIVLYPNAPDSGFVSQR